MNNQYTNTPYNSVYYPNQNLNNYLNKDNQKTSYLETILKVNIGKKIEIYASFPDSIEWRDKIFYGTLEEAGIDHVLITDNDNKPIILQSIYINFIKFDNKLNLNF